MHCRSCPSRSSIRLWPIFSLRSGLQSWKIDWRSNWALIWKVRTLLRRIIRERWANYTSCIMGHWILSILPERILKKIIIILWRLNIWRKRIMNWGLLFKIIIKSLKNSRNRLKLICFNPIRNGLVFHDKFFLSPKDTSNKTNRKF